MDTGHKSPFERNEKTWWLGKTSKGPATISASPQDGNHMEGKPRTESQREAEEAGGQVLRLPHKPPQLQGKEL